MCVFLHVCVYVNHMASVKWQLLPPQTHVVKRKTTENPRNLATETGSPPSHTCLGNTHKHAHTRTLRHTAQHVEGKCENVTRTPSEKCKQNDSKKQIFRFLKWVFPQILKAGKSVFQQRGLCVSISVILRLFPIFILRLSSLPLAVCFRSCLSHNLCHLIRLLVVSPAARVRSRSLFIFHINFCTAFSSVVWV